MISSVGLAAAFLAGMASFLSPCILPLVPVYFSYLLGVSYDDLKGSVPRLRLWLHSVAFVLGFSLVFILLGASATFLGKLLLRYQLILERIGGAFLVFLGLWTLGALRLPFLYKEFRWHFEDKPAGVLGSVLVGSAFAAGWTPCVGPILAAVLFYASRASTVEQGVLLLSAYSLGMAVPFLLCSLAVEKTSGWMKKSKSFSRMLRALEWASGAFLILAGIFLLAGWTRWISSYLLSRFGNWMLF